MNATPAGNEPHRPHTDGTLAPTAPGTPPTETIPLTKTQKILTGIVVGAVLVIATLGFIGSYSAVTDLAKAKGFGDFAHAFPIAVDAGIIAFLALDLLLTWRRIPYPLLRQGAWMLTAATIAFNAAAAWPDALAVGMHAVIPVLFVIAVEAARHAIGRIADITADKHIDGVPLARWLVAPFGSFRIWRRMRLWNIRSYETVIALEQERRIYCAQLRKEHGRGWRRKARAEQILVLRLARDGMSIKDAIELPEQEAQKLAEAEAKRTAEANQKAEAEAEAKHQTELRNAEVEAKRRAEIAEAEAAEVRARSEAEAAEAEAKYRTEAAAEAARLEVEAKRRAAAEAARILEAETEAKLAEIARGQQNAQAEAELKLRENAVQAARLEAEQRQQARRAAEEADRERRAERARSEAQRLASEARTTSATSTSVQSGPGSSATASGTTSGSAPRSIAPQRGKRQAEVEAVLARLVEADDPKCVSLEDVMNDFDLKQTTAYDRLKTAQDLYTQAQAQSA